jgi:hypothetical protein
MTNEKIDITLLLKRLETDYPLNYNVNVLREAARVIRELQLEKKNGQQ